MSDYINELERENETMRDALEKIIKFNANTFELDASGMKHIAMMALAELSKREKLTEAEPDLLASLQQFMTWLDEGLLVRDISKDASADWAPKMMEFVVQLNNAKAAIAKAEA